MNFSTYKKKKWKSLKGANNPDGLDSGVLKCFKCGDVGHFARQCKSVGDLLPYEEDIDEESIFPTLAEAEEMAKEVAKTTRVRKEAPVEIKKPVTNEPAVSSEDAELVEDILGSLPPVPEAENKSIISPVYELNEDGSVIDTPLEVLQALYKFGFDEFRDGQETAVMRVLSGLSTLVSLATGSGKSLCYQLPAYLYHTRFDGAITLVVSPLVSLMEDQVSCCGGLIKMACLHRNQTEKQRQTVIERLKSKELAVLLVAPESLTPDSASSFTAHLPPIAFACVDEAHCLSHWSHNFRPSYLTVCQVLRERLGVKTLLGLTATVSLDTVDRVLEVLGAPPDALVSSSTQLPDNLLLTVSCDRDRDQALLGLLQGERFSQCSSVIVYCTRREECNRVATLLRINLQDLNTIKKSRLSSEAEVYHAGLTPARRKQVQNAFMTGKVRIVVATVAFGMGINKNDLRGIIHYNMPSSFENYVQEVGRAGRDGQISHCHLFLDSLGGDVNELRRHIYANSVDRGTLRRLLELIVVKKTCAGVCERHETAFSVESTVEALDLPQENICTLLSYLDVSGAANIKSLSLAYTLARVTSYKGPRHLAQQAKTCPPLAVGIATYKSEGKKVKSSVEFNVVSVASSINWDSGIVKRNLKNLEWTKTDDGRWQKSGINVELANLGFRLLSPCNLSCEEMDKALDVLHNNVLEHEERSLRQLQSLYNSLLSVSHKSVMECGDTVDDVRCDKLFSLIKTYFTSKHALKDVKIEKSKIECEGDVANDICNLIGMYPENSFTGRAIARILHGINSPNYPAVVWGRTKFWRLHLRQDFNELCRLATKQLIYMR